MMPERTATKGIHATAAALMIWASVLVAGCSGTDTRQAVEAVNQRAEQDGSPWRWEQSEVDGATILKKSLIGIAAQTSADPELQRFTLGQIHGMETDLPLTPDQQPEEVRLVSATDSSVREVWVFDSDDRRVAYVIEFSPAASGGTTVNIRGPYR